MSAHKKPKITVITTGSPSMKLESVALCRSPYGYFIRIDTEEKRPEILAGTGSAGGKEYANILIVDGNKGTYSVKVMGAYDPIVYDVRYGATVLLMPKDHFKLAKVMEQVYAWEEPYAI